MSLSESSSSSMVEEAKGVVSHNSAPEEEDTDTDPESVAHDPEVESSEDSKKEASDDDEEELTKKSYDEDDKKFLEKDVATDSEVGGTDLKGVEAQEVSKAHHDKIEGTVLSIGDDNDEEETNNDVSSSSQTTVLPADVQSDVEMVETNTANAGVRIIGIIVAIILSCLICIVIVKCFSNATSMKEQRRIPSTFSSSNSFPQLGSVLEKISMFLKTNATDEFPSHQRDEENGTSSNSHENSNVTSTATTTMPAATRVAAVKSVDSTSAWVEDVLNETYETQSSSSSSYHSTLDYNK